MFQQALRKGGGESVKYAAKLNTPREQARRLQNTLGGELLREEKMTEPTIMLPYMDVELVSKELQAGIRNKVREASARGAVLGLSGGVDSSCVAYVTKHAFKGTDFRIYGVALYSGIDESKDEDLKDARRVAELLGIELIETGIQPSLNIIMEAMPYAFGRPLHRQNLASEVRAVMLSREAAYRGSILLNTGNRDEDHGIGYCTKRGDNLGDLAPIAELPKRLVRELVAYEGAPEDIVQRVPTARLEQGQTDETDLGYMIAHRGIAKFSGLSTYDYVEIVTYGLDQGFSPEEIHKITGFKPEVINDIKRRHLKDAPHKGKVAPESIPVTLEYKSFSLDDYVLKE